jgi:hypothetical protein
MANAVGTQTTMERLAVPLTRGAITSDEDTLCANTLFQQPWWLDVLAPGSWDAAVVVENGETIGRLPFVRKRRLGLTILSQPPLTPFLGPWIKAGIGKAQTRLEREHEVLRKTHRRVAGARRFHSELSLRGNELHRIPLARFFTISQLHLRAR